MKIARKPEWLRKQVHIAAQDEIERLPGELRLDTVCPAARIELLVPDFQGSRSRVTPRDRLF